MHYYQHHIGDFIKDTSFLTNEEVGIYLKLLWLYYDTEQPLEDNLVSLTMKTNSRDNKDAVATILSTFFTLTDGAWHHSRCDSEIEEYHALIESRSRAGKASAQHRKSKRSASVEHVLNTSSSDEQLTINHEPITNNHINTKARAARFDAIAYLLSLGVEQSIASDWMQSRKQLKATVTKTAIDGIAREAAKAYISLTAALQECCARGWRGFKAEWIAEKSNGSETPYQKSQRLRFERLTGRTSPQEKVVSGEILTLKGN